MTARTQSYVVEVRVTLREADHARQQTAFHTEMTGTLQEALYIFSRYIGSIDHVHEVIESECKPAWAGERHLEG